MPEFLLNWWSVFLALVGFIAWLSRLEMKVIKNTESDTLIRQEIKDLETRLSTQRTEDIEEAHRTWDKFDAKLDTMQGDIKEILKRSTK